MTSTTIIMDQYSNGGQMRSGVPDSHLPSPYPPNDSPPSFYDHSNSFYLPPSTTSSSNKKLSEMMHLFEDPPLDLPDLDNSQFSPYWTDVLSAPPLSSSPSSIDPAVTSSFPIPSTDNIPLPSMNTLSPTNNYLDLSLFCEPPGMVTPPTECSSMLPHTLPISAPISPDQQEIEDIMTSIQEDLLPYNTSQYVLQDSPSSFVSTPTTCDDIIPQMSPEVTSPIADATLQAVSSATCSVLMTPPCPISPTLAIPSPTTTSAAASTQHAKTKPATAKKQSRRKMSVSKKKERKKEQNKTAALRYRQKKREEAMVIEDRQEELEKKNKELKNEVYCLENEIKYLKQLWSEVSMARQKQTNKHTH